MFMLPQYKAHCITPLHAFALLVNTRLPLLGFQILSIIGLNLTKGLLQNHDNGWRLALH